MYFLKRFSKITILVIILMIPAFFSNAYEYNVSGKDKAIFKNAFAKTRHDQFDVAIKDASYADDKLIEKIIKWIGYQDGYANNGFQEISTFIKKNPHWP